MKSGIHKLIVSSAFFLSSLFLSLIVTDNAYAKQTKVLRISPLRIYDLLIDSWALIKVSLRAPTRCGEYFFYIHPKTGSRTHPSGFEKCKYCIVYAVTRTAPDNKNINTVPVIWAEADDMSSISSRIIVARRELIPRQELWPAPYVMNVGNYIQSGSKKNHCHPYRPTVLLCGETIYCDPKKKE